MGRASTGEDALRRALEKKPDLILMDIILDGEMDGIEATQQIKNKCNIPVVYLTAHSNTKAVKRASQTKPPGTSENRLFMYSSILSDGFRLYM